MQSFLEIGAIIIPVLQIRNGEPERLSNLPGEIYLHSSSLAAKVPKGPGGSLCPHTGC